ncbi:unnamed protein product [Meganyctiphanes norvegica]|uniref:RRM domain-containing protein n=1 Tax=Meganyctiphanes norvegica TaxID=48144 RepID=A0AAV2RCM4_MEGNR
MEANKEALESLEVNGEKALVDYVGEKSKNPAKNSAAVPKKINHKKLFVSNFPKLVTSKEVKEAFDGCSHVDMPISNTKDIRNKRRYCFVYYEEETAAQKAFENALNITLGGKKVFVTYAKDKVAAVKRKKNRKPASESPAKKQKVEAPKQKKKKGKAAEEEEEEEVEEPVKQKAKKGKAAPAKVEDEDEDDDDDDDDSDDEMEAEDDDDDDDDD